MSITRRNPVLVLIFSMITCGIYYFYWIYQTSEALRPFNRNDNLTPALELLLCILCAPYIIYWNYKYGKIIFEVQRELEMPYPEDNTILYLILSILGLGLVGAIIMQASLNKTWDQYELVK